MAFDFSQPRWQAELKELSGTERNQFLRSLQKSFPEKPWDDVPMPNEYGIVIVFGSFFRNEGVFYRTDLDVECGPFQTAIASDIREFIAATLGEEKPKYIQQIGRMKRENSGNGYCDDHTGNKYHRKIRDIKGRQCMVFDQDRQEYVPAFVDFYSIERACALPGGGITHCAKKVLFCGIRGKGDSLQDLIEARDALTREIESIKTERAEGSCKQD